MNDITKLEAELLKENRDLRKSNLTFAPGKIRQAKQIEQLETENLKLQILFEEAVEFQEVHYREGRNIADEEVKQLKDEVEWLKEGIKLAIECLPECPDEAKAILEGALKRK